MMYQCCSHSQFEVGLHFWVNIGPFSITSIIDIIELPKFNVITFSIFELTASMMPHALRYLKNGQAYRAVDHYTQYRAKKPSVLKNSSWIPGGTRICSPAITIIMASPFRGRLNFITSEDSYWCCDGTHRIHLVRRHYFLQQSTQQSLSVVPQLYWLEKNMRTHTLWLRHRFSLSTWYDGRCRTPLPAMIIV